MDNLVLERAKTAVLARDFILASRLYKTLLKTEPENMDILQALGDIYVKSGEDEKAIPYYENILAFDNHNVSAMNSLGAIYRRLKDYEKSVEILQRALEEDTDTAITNYTLGFTFKEMGNYDDAIECFENVTSENPNDVLAYNHLGVIYAQKKEYNKAINSYRRGLQIDPNHPIIQFNMAHAFEGLKDITTAAKCYELALKSKPGWSDAIIDYSTLLGKCNKISHAVTLLRKATLLHPTEEAPFKLLGQFYLKQFDWQNAETTFSKANRIRPNEPWVLSGLGESLEKNGKSEQAVNYIKTVLGDENVTEELHKQYAHILLSAEYINDAKRVIDGLLEKNPDDPHNLDLLAQYYICTGESSKVDGLFSEIHQLSEKYRHHLLDAARRYLQIGDTANAKKYVSEYLKTRSSNGAGWILLGEICVKEQDYDAAIHAYEKALEMSEKNVVAENALRVLAEREPEKVNEIIEKKNEVSEEEGDTLLELVEEDKEFDFGQISPVVEPEVTLDELKKSENASFDEVIRNVENITESEVPVENNELTIDDLTDADEVEELVEPPEEPPLKIKSEPITVENMPEFNPPIPPLPTKEQETNQQIADSVMQAAERAEEMAKSVAETQEKILDAVAKLAGQQQEPNAFSTDSPLVKSVNPDFHYNEREMPVNAIFDEPDFSAPFENPDPFAAFETTTPDFGTIPYTPEETVETIAQNVQASKALNNAKKLLPNIVKMLEDKDKAERFHSEIDLFQKLRGLSNFLGPEDKKRFNSSRTRLLMDFLLAKMSGAPGLLKTMTGLIKSGAMGDNVDYQIMEKAVAGLTGDELTKKVLNDMKNMTENLADRDLAKALNDAADEALQQL